MGTAARQRGLTWALTALAGLCLLTVLAALPGNPAGPFDARTGARLEGFRLESAPAAALLEPFVAAGSALGGAPDHRAAILSSLVWLVLLCAAGVFVRSRGRDSWGLAAARAGAAGLAAALCFSGYVLLLLLVRPPSWRLVAPAGEFLIADLQSHTFASHDGLASAEANLRLHAAHGYDVVAVTEHEDSGGADAAAALAAREPGLPAVLAGAELRERGGGYLLALGARLQRDRVEPEDLRDAGRFCSFVHAGGGGGAVLALSWKLTPADAGRLADAGVDGFEIANYGHPAMPEPVREAILDTARGRGLVLASSSDWHGWGGFWRTWTAVRVPGGRTLPRERRAAAVLEALRGRRAQDLLPVVAGRLGRPSAMRVLFAPFVEAVRYARELSPLRVVSWWLWILALFAGAGLLRGRGWEPVPALGSAALGAAAAGLLGAGGSLISARLSGAAAYGFPLRLGLWACFAGLVLAAGAAAAFRRAMPRRTG